MKPQIWTVFLAFFDRFHRDQAASLKLYTQLSDLYPKSCNLLNRKRLLNPTFQALLLSVRMDFDTKI